MRGLYNKLKHGLKSCSFLIRDGIQSHLIVNYFFSFNLRLCIMKFFVCFGEGDNITGSE